nr:retrotransposon protein, putative, Ty1-copia subclass [Tanacetum cinerariifolium]
MGKTVNELHAMLKLHEQTLPKSNAPALNAIRAGKYLAELMIKKKNTASGAGGSGIFIIELNTILNRSWIYDTGCGTHICNSTQGLRASRKLEPGALSLYVGTGQRKAVEEIGAFYLCLPSGLEIVLNNCHYAPSITRGVISVSRLYEDGFVNRFVDNTIHVSRNNMVYFCVIPRDCIFEIDFKKRIEKLQHYGLLNSSDLTAFEKCVSCMSGKMERKPYTHQVERAKDLLRLIHTYVCGPFKIMSRQGASYFVTFTDDFSRYGYVYLLKHKHEVFETFKVFQKEVENQLGKTIKSLRSDRGGEYMSQEFLDHLKDHEIITHRTPPYTSQHNGVSERRNRTLLDMVRYMMSQTTLPKSFWDYALET